MNTLDEIQAETFHYRSRLLAALPEAVRAAKARRKTREAHAGGGSMLDLFGLAAGPGASPEATHANGLPLFDPPDAPCLPLTDLLQGELDTLGYYISGHPIERWGPLVDAMATHGCGADLSSVTSKSGSAKPGGSPGGSSKPGDPAGMAAIVLGGIVSDLKFKTLKKSRSEHNRMARFSLQDASGIARCLMWPDIYVIRNHAEILTNGAAVFVIGSPGDREESREVVCSLAIPARSAAPRFARAIGIVIEDGKKEDGCLDDDELVAFAARHPGPMPLLFNVRPVGSDGRLAAGPVVRPTGADPEATHYHMGCPRRAWTVGLDPEGNCIPVDLGVKLGAAMINDAEETFGAGNVYLVGRRGEVSREYLMGVEG
jgi:DNA polymerase III alpha subunit